MVESEAISTLILRSHDGVNMADDGRLVKTNDVTDFLWGLARVWVGLKNAEQDQDQDQFNSITLRVK